MNIDPAQLDQVILNLVLNSRDALPDGGSIRLEVACVRLSDSDVPSDQPIRATDYARLRVVDDGVGIAPEVRAHLLEPFFTTGIVRQSNGFIGVASEPGLGTTFTMHFPAVGAVASLEKPTVAPAAGAGGGETILLGEDEDAVRVIVGATLRRHGYDAIEAATPHGACEVFEQRGSNIDLLMTDVVMPDMNGPALAQRPVAERPEPRVLLISGYANVPSFDAGYPNVSFLSKPFQASALAAKVREVLTRPRH